jgi:glutamate transport system permease protein
MSSSSKSSPKSSSKSSSKSSPGLTATSTSVLFDIPGPLARRRHRLAGVLGGAAVLGVLAYVIYRFAATGQFDGRKWSILEYKNPQIVLLEAYLNTLEAAAVAAVFALFLGALFAAARLSDHAPARAPAFALVELFRAIPLLLLMFLFYYGTPTLGIRVDPFWAVVLGLTLYNGAVLAEIFRAGIEAVPRGQSEAAYALGMRKTQVMVKILLPQAVRTMLPTIISQLVVLLKDTALGFLVTYDELLKQIKQLASAPDFDFPLIPLVIVGGTVYVATCILLSLLATWVEGRTRRSKKIAHGDEIDEAKLAALTAGGTGQGAPPL